MKAKWLEEMMQRKGFESLDVRGIRIGKYCLMIGKFRTSAPKVNK